MTLPAAVATACATFPDVLREAPAIREGGGSEHLDDRAARGQDTADLTAYVVAEGAAC